MAVPFSKVAPTSIVVFGDSPLLSVLVEISTDAGITGIGESPVIAGAEICKSIIDAATPLLIGEDPFHVDRLRMKFYARFNLIHFHLHTASWAFSGIDTALWDIVGKACGQSLCRLWGGGYRNKVKFWGWVPQTTFSEMQNEAKRYVERGFDCLYLKVGLDRRHDVESVKAIREAVGYDVDLRIDANQAWTPSGAIQMIRKMEKYDLEFVEQPVLMYNLDALARVRDAVSTPILSHESSWTYYDTLNVLKKDAADAVQLDPRFDAGVWGFRVAAGMAEAAGIAAVAHSFGELGVATAFMLHAIASSRSFVYANQTAYTFLADDILEGGMMKFENGHLPVPEKPGLGVKLDASKIEKYAEFYNHEIRKRIPDSMAISKEVPWTQGRKQGLDSNAGLVLSGLVRLVEEYKQCANTLHII